MLTVVEQLIVLGVLKDTHKRERLFTLLNTDNILFVQHELR